MLLLLAAAWCGCGQGMTNDGAAPDIRGRITGVIVAPERMRRERIAGFLKVEGAQSGGTRYSLAAVTVTDTTVLLRTDSLRDHPAGFGEFHAGDSVEAWFIGPAAGSIPPLATAARLRLLARP
ncbi:MAG TPA: hypothetical protein VHI13_10550 [Candidatus Kapabacteria bacterium]|nr:hypothetical protein [Candidatus Kapabacteria bacterium]